MTASITPSGPARWSAARAAGRRAASWLAALLALLAAVAAVTPFATSPPAPAYAPAVTVETPATPWAAAAEARIAAELAAARRGVADLVSLYGPEVEVDPRPWSGRVLLGRDALRKDLEARFGPTLEELQHLDVAVDAAGAAVRQRFTGDPRFAGPSDLLEVRTYGPHGVQRVRVLASLATLQRLPTGPSATAFEVVGAVIRRELAIWPDHALGATTEGEGDAVYLDHRVPAAVRTVALVLEPRSPSRCPGAMTVVLELDDDGEVERRRELDAPADVRRCDPKREGGWWDHLDAGGDDTSRPIDVDGVEVRGVTSASAELVRWALGRFDAARLPRPSVAAVTFATGTGRCLGIAGTVTAGPDGQEVLLCFDDDAICADAGCTTFRLAPRMTVLHEFAHVWEADHLDPADRARYLARTGLATWMGADAPWSQRGGERTAEVLMWGLLESAVPLVRLEEPSRQQLVTEFRQLTGVEPPVSARAAS
jgi:hypothetical protein